MNTPPSVRGSDESTGGVRRLVVTNSHSELRRVSEWVRAFAHERRLPRQLAYGLELAVDEALTNTMSYAFRDGGRHEIAIALHAQPDRIRVEIEDDGVPFNPLTVPEESADSLEKSRPTGRGITIMRGFMDHMQYARRNDKNVLTLVLVVDSAGH